MSTLVERMAQYAAALRWEELGADVTDCARRILLDSLACLYGGLESEPARIVRRTLPALGAGGQATVLGESARAPAPQAALANGVALRYQDYNDVYFGPAWTAHPSDNLAALLAVGEWVGCSGREFLTAMVIAYEVQMRFADLPVARNLWHAGWHHTGACAYAAAAGVGRLLGLDAVRTGHAIALAGARCNTLSEIRHGDIPMDKALSAPMVASQSIPYALLAREGFTGCTTLLEGPYGFGQAVAGGADVEPLVPEPGDFRILKVSLKPYPVEGMTPAMVQAALELRAEHRIAPAEIETLRILVHEEALSKPSWDDRKLAPTTKETADHSFTYCVAVALVAGEVTAAQFDARWLENPQVRGLMDKAALATRPELTALFKQGARPATVEIGTPRGVFTREVRYPKGDPHNPMTWDDVGAKFRTQAAPFLREREAGEVVARTAALESEPDLRAFVAALAAPWA